MNLLAIKNKQDLEYVLSKGEYIPRCDSIRLKCLECMNYNIRNINKCTNTSCPLYNHRKGYGK